MERIVYRSVAEIWEVVERFERCVYRPEEFTHGRHLTVAAWYLEKDPSSALARMREGLQRFLAHHGKQSGYHETITRFWMLLLARSLYVAPSDWSLARRVTYVIGCFQDKNVLFAYYSRDRVLSEEARMGWLEPDLQPFETEELRPAR